MSKSKENLDFIELPICGKKVTIKDISKADGNLLMKAREECGGGAKTAVFILAELAEFDGQKLTGFDILDLDLEDVITLEDFYAEKKHNYALTLKKSST